MNDGIKLPLYEEFKAFNIVTGWFKTKRDDKGRYPMLIWGDMNGVWYPKITKYKRFKIGESRDMRKYKNNYITLTMSDS